MTLPSDSSYREIPLTQGQVALVSEQDYELISPYKWYARWSKSTRSYYAVRNERLSNGHRITVLMHRDILHLGHGDKREADHIEIGKTLDNRRQNLRVATRSENQHNKNKQRNNTSGFKGVSWDRKVGKYRAYIGVNKKKLHLGYGDTPEDAYTLVRVATLFHYGRFAKLQL